jgi:hypothetical protein
MANERTDLDRDENRDPITGEPGAHPVGAGLGAAAGGAAAGAAAGAAFGPVGTVVGTIAGGVAGGLAGKEIAEQIDPTAEEHYWRNEYPNRTYYDPTVGYPEVGPAYQHGWESRAKYRDRSWDEVEPEIAHDWTAHHGDSSLDWGRARPATRDAWNRVDERMRGEGADVGAAQRAGQPQNPMPRTPK